MTTQARPSPTWSTTMTGIVVAIVGFFSSFPIVLKGLDGVGASAVQATSGLMEAAFAMGLTGIALSLWTRMPMSVAWSTPGVALLAGAAGSGVSFEAAVGAFLLAGVLTTLAGLWTPLAQAAASIPPTIAQAMLAGVLLPLCLAPFAAIGTDPWIAAPLILVWFAVGRLSRLAATPAMVLVAAGLIIWDQPAGTLRPDALISPMVWTTPAWDVTSLVSIGLPLFVVTMATQNIPGLAVLRGNGFDAPAGQSIASVGVASVLSAPFGAPATCLAAITAAMCSGADADPDARKRFWAAVVAGAVYCLFGLFAAAITHVTTLAPAVLISAVAGLALLNVMTGALVAAYGDTEVREAAALTFVVTASGVSLFGVSSALWGLIAGLCLIGLTRLRT